MHSSPPPPPPPVGGPLLAPLGWLRSQPQEFHSGRSSPHPGHSNLHQAHLRSPILAAKSLTSSLYHYPAGYMQKPVKLMHAGRKTQQWSFMMTPRELRKRPRLEASLLGGPAKGNVSEKSQTIRLRCIQWLDDSLPDEHAWAVADTSWLPYAFFTFNGISLEPRKKTHHGKDLAIDLSALLRVGENVLKIAVAALSRDNFYLNYALALETLALVSHQSVKHNCLCQRMSGKDVVRSIRYKLSQSANQEDELVGPGWLTICLFDPFSASKMCDIPVRSRACTHHDCFDLDTFLHTRRRKGDISDPDQWRCPICRADARPQHLFVDGFMEDVAETLTRQGLAATRSIIVMADGLWKPKPDTSPAIRFFDMPREPLHRRSSSATPIPIEIIDHTR